jgi:predicted amidohydrolase YtcJ
MSHFLLGSVEVDGRVIDVRLRDGLITDLGDGLAADGAEVIDGRGGALLPGLVDHHLHLAATAAAAESITSTGQTASELAARIRTAAPGPVRVVGWHESEPLGDLDADALDDLAPGRDVRVRHRSGSVWVLSRATLAALAAAGPLDHEGLERGADGQVTGRLFRGDSWLRERLPTELPDFQALVGQLSAYGLTGLTDATPDLDATAVRALTQAFPQRLLLLGDPQATGPWKLLLPEHDLPDLASLTASVASAHAAGRPVAIHSVTRDSLVLAMAALDDAGGLAGDRLEHAAIVPAEVRHGLRRLGVTVVTQPGIATSRGDFHRRDVEPDDQAWLWPLRSLLDEGVPVALSSDAPHGPLDPWEVMRAARDRLTPSGAPANPAERITAAAALRSLTTALEDPGGPAREVRVGEVADLVLYQVPQREVLADLDREAVRAVFAEGTLIFGPVF